MKATDWITMLVIIILWGLNLIVVRIGVQEIPPLLLTALRLLLVSIIIVPFTRLQREKLLIIPLLGITMGIGHFGFMFLGLRGTDAATAIIAIQLGIPFNAFLAWWIFDDRPGSITLLGMLISLSGVMLLVGESISGEVTFIMLIVASGLFWAISNVIAKQLSYLHPVTLNGWSALYATPLLLGLSVLFEHDQWHTLSLVTWRGWGAVVYTAICSSIVAYTLWYRLIAIYSLSKVVHVTVLTQLVGVAGGVLFLDETVTCMNLLGCSLTIIGVIVTEFHHYHVTTLSKTAS